MEVEGSCPFCKVHAKIRGDEVFNADTTVIRPSNRYYSNVVDVKKPQTGVMVWGYGPQIYFPIKKLQDSGEFGDLTDPKEGRDIIINRQVRGKVTDSVYPSNKISMIENPDWLDQLVDLDDILPSVDFKLVERLFASHPWKVYEPSGREVDHNLTSGMEPKHEEPSKQPVEEVDRMAQINSLEARLRAKMQAKASQ